MFVVVVLQSQVLSCVKRYLNDLGRRIDDVIWKERESRRITHDDVESKSVLLVFVHLVTVFHACLPHAHVSGRLKYVNSVAPAGANAVISLSFRHLL